MAINRRGDRDDPAGGDHEMDEGLRNIDAAIMMVLAAEDERVAEAVERLPEYFRWLDGPGRTSSARTSDSRLWLLHHHCGLIREVLERIWAERSIDCPELRR